MVTGPYASILEPATGPGGHPGGGSGRCVSGKSKTVHMKMGLRTRDLGHGGRVKSVCEPTIRGSPGPCGPPLRLLAPQPDSRQPSTPRLHHSDQPATPLHYPSPSVATHPSQRSPCLAAATSSPLASWPFALRPPWPSPSSPRSLWPLLPPKPRTRTRPPQSTNPTTRSCAPSAGARWAPSGRAAASTTSRCTPTIPTPTWSASRPAGSGRRPTTGPPSGPSSTATARTRSATWRSRPRAPTSCGSAPVRPTTGKVPRSATECTSTPTAARPSHTWACARPRPLHA